MDYNVVYEIDPNWSGYDKSVAQGMLYDFGEIYVDSYGTPIDDEYWVEDIRNERTARKEKKAMKKRAYNYDDCIERIESIIDEWSMRGDYQKVDRAFEIILQHGGTEDDSGPDGIYTGMDIGDLNAALDELNEMKGIWGSRKAMRKRAAGPYYKWKKVDNGYYRYRNSDPEYYYELEQKGSGWQLDICDEYGYSQVDRILGEYGNGHDGFFDTPQDAVDWLNQNLPWLSGSWGNPIAEPTFRLGSRKAMRKRAYRDMPKDIALPRLQKALDDYYFTWVSFDGERDLPDMKPDYSAIFEALPDGESYLIEVVDFSETLSELYYEFPDTCYRIVERFAEAVRRDLDDADFYLEPYSGYSELVGRAWPGRNLFAWKLRR